MTKPTGNSKCRPPLKSLEKFMEARMERGGSGITAKIPFFLLTYRQFRSVKDPSHCDGRKPVCSLLGWGADGRELANWRACCG